MKKLSRFCAMVLTTALLFTGCSNVPSKEERDSDRESLVEQEDTEREKESGESGENSEPEENSQPLESSKGQGSAAVTGATAYGAAITVADIKKAYDYDDSKDIMPLYNVAEDEHFDFHFRFSAYDENVELYDFVSIHTDAACEEESSIYYTAKLEVEDGKTNLTIAPMTPVLATDSQQHEYVYDEVESWGNAPIYYIAIHYDMEADSPVKLAKPIVIPFTVKHEVTAPTVHGVVDADGRFSLQWEPVPGAEKYIIYTFIDNSVSTGKDNHAIDGAKIGYDCGKNTQIEEQLYLLADGETTECSYDGFAGPESHSMAVIYDDMSDKYSNSGQNYSVCGEYFVTAVVNGKESGLSNVVPTAGLAIPYVVKEESRIQGRYPTPADFPSEVEVLNIDGSSTMRRVSYERTHVVWFDFEWDEYDYAIEGTKLYGHVRFDSDAGEAPKTDDFAFGTGNASPEDEVDRIPEADVETIIPTLEEPDEDEDETLVGEGEGETPIDEGEDEIPDDEGEDETPTDEDEDETPIGEDQPDEGTLIEEQAENTQDHIENGNKASVAGLPEGVYINAETAEEEWLALNLLQGNSDISVEAFSSLQNPYTLVDVFYKVYYQNPYAMGIRSFGYDYKTFTFHIEYVNDPETTARKQAEIAAKADSVVSSVIRDGMTTAEKIDALYNYLVEHSVYDNDVLKEAEAQGFSTTQGFSHEDAFTTYGILVEGKGVCMSYAYSFRLLCDLSGVDCIVATGYLNGNLPHAWNMVNIDGKWYEIDCTNNAVNTGIPYFMYQTDTGLANNMGYTKDEKFAMDSELNNFKGLDGSLEYYYQNGLCPEDIEEYRQLILANVTEDTGVFAVRWQGELDAEAFKKGVILAFNELGMEDKLPNMRYNLMGGFLIIIIE